MDCKMDMDLKHTPMEVHTRVSGSEECDMDMESEPVLHSVLPHIPREGTEDDPLCPLSSLELRKPPKLWLMGQLRVTPQRSEVGLS